MIVRGTLTLALAGAILAVPAAAQARPQVGWVKADRYAKQKRRPTLYYPGGLLDGRNRTVFCVETDKAPGTRITFGFRGRGKINQVKIVTGDATNSGSFRRSARVKTLVIHELGYVREIRLQDSASTQTVKLNPPLAGETVTVEIKDVHGEGKLTCLSDLVFYSRGKALSGSWMGRGLKYSRTRTPLLGIWAAGPEGAPEKFLSLYLDGSFRWVFRPNDPDLKGKTLKGRWMAKGRKLTLKTGGKTLALKLRRKRVVDEFTDEPRVELELSGGGKAARHIVGRYYDSWL